jgi:hypothetical protein
MPVTFYRYFACLPLLASFSLSGVTRPAQADDDPPTQVGRISYLDGTTTLRHDHDKDWSDAQLNYPVTAGDQLWTDPHSHMELQVGATEVRMDGATEVDIQKLEDDKTVFYIDQGAANIHLRGLPNGTVTLLTPRGKIDLLRTGSYHVSVDYVDGDNRPPLVKLVTLEGEAHVYIQGDDDNALTGEKVVINGDPASLTVMEGESTDFDDWALSHEQRDITDETTRYVSEETTGYQDLDENGHWVNDPDYGALWFPLAVAATWAPYRYGRWEFLALWGWTWIDDAPWGFTPFHYGRWVSVHGAWGWCPGERGYHPVFAPALVSFVGHPYGIEHGGPGVGWIPLGPHEIYQPTYHSSENYMHNINVSYVAHDHFDVSHRPGQPPGHFMNEQVLHGGISSVEHHPGQQWNGHDTPHRDEPMHDSGHFPAVRQESRPAVSMPSGDHRPTSTPGSNRESYPSGGIQHQSHAFHVQSSDFPSHQAPDHPGPGLSSHPHPQQPIPLQPTHDGWRRIDQGSSLHTRH